MANVLADLILLLRGDNSDLDKKLKATRAELATFSKETQALGTSLTNLGTKLSFGLTAPLAGVALSSLKLSGELEQNKIAFTTMLGSVDAAQQHLDKLRAFADATPFQFTDVVTASKRLQALGFTAQDVIPTLTAVGNAAAALGGGAQKIEQITTALGQIKAKGKVQAEEIQQLAEAGIPAWQLLAKTLNTDVAGAMKLVEKRAVDSSVAVPALIAGINDRFAGLIDAQSKTLLGRLSTFQDKIAKVLTDTGTALAPLASEVLEFADKTVTKVTSLAKAFEGLPKPIKEAGLALTAFAAAGGPTLLVAGQFARALADISGATKAALPYLTKIGPAFGAATFITGTAIALGYVGEKIIELGAHADSEKTKVDKLLSSVAAAHTAVRGNIAPVIQADPTLSTLLDYTKALDKMRGAGGAAAVTAEELEKALSKLGFKSLSQETKDLTSAFATIGRSGTLSISELAAAGEQLKIKLAQIKASIGDEPFKALGVTRPFEALSVGAVAVDLLSKGFLAGRVPLADYQLGYEAFLKKVAESNVPREGLKLLNDEFIEGRGRLLDYIDATDKANEALRTLPFETVSESARGIVTNVQLVAEALNHIVSPGQSANKELQQLTFDLNVARDAFSAGAISSGDFVAALNRVRDANIDLAGGPSFAALGIKSQKALDLLADKAAANYEAIKDDATSTANDIARAWVAKIDSQIAAGGRLDDATRAQYERIKNAVGGNISQIGLTWRSLGKEVTTVVNNLERGLVGAIVNFKSLGDVGKTAISELAAGLIQLGLETETKKLLDHLASVSGVIGEIARGLGGVASQAKAAVTSINDLSIKINGSVMDRIPGAPEFPTPGGTTPSIPAGGSAPSAASSVIGSALSGWVGAIGLSRAE